MVSGGCIRPPLVSSLTKSRVVRGVRRGGRHNAHTFCRLFCMQTETHSLRRKEAFMVCCSLYINPGWRWVMHLYGYAKYVYDRCRSRARPIGARFR